MQYGPKYLSESDQRRLDSLTYSDRYVGIALSVALGSRGDHVADRYRYAYCDVLRAGRRLAVLHRVGWRHRARSGLHRFGAGPLAALRAARRATPEAVRFLG